MNTPMLINQKVEVVPIDQPVTDPNNPWRHSEQQIGQIQRSMRAFGHMNPLLVDGDDNVIAGHGGLEAAKRCELKKIPVIRIENLAPERIMAYRMADNMAVNGFMPSWLPMAFVSAATAEPTARCWLKLQVQGHQLLFLHLESQD